ncbi:glycosyltransferase [Flavobacterium sp.]|uniref:glycosyltransferase n=1 Tax=Flavobacterium sp. TaxID=239 RepID=UPI002633BE5E|nr:glycosyltransferase [Flavobacterium sp.]
MKKDILFVMNKLSCGGAEKSLVSLLHLIDYSKYNVDLYLFKHEGFLMKQLPKEVNLLPQPKEFQYFDMPFKQMALECLSSFNFKILWARFRMSLMLKSEKIPAVKEQKAWEFIGPCLKKVTKKYDATIGYLEKIPNYFCVDHVNADIKIGFVNNDYKLLMLDEAIDIPYFEKLDYIVTVSEACEDILVDCFPQFKHKIRMMYNILTEKTINGLAEESISDFDESNINLVSLGRLNYQKAFDGAIEACAILVKRNPKIKWYVLGDGEDRQKLEKLIAQHHLQNNFILLGIKENPYPYIKKATLYVQPSRFEGKSLAIDEAKIICKPILVTNFPSAKDQITDGVNGRIVGMEPIDIANGIEALVNDSKMMNLFVENLQKEETGTESEMSKLYDLIESK